MKRTRGELLEDYCPHIIGADFSWESFNQQGFDLMDNVYENAIRAGLLKQVTQALNAIANMNCSDVTKHIEKVGQIAVDTLTRIEQVEDDLR